MSNIGINSITGQWSIAGTDYDPPPTHLLGGDPANAKTLDWIKYAYDVSKTKHPLEVNDILQNLRTNSYFYGDFAIPLARDGSLAAAERFANTYAGVWGPGVVQGVIVSGQDLLKLLRGALDIVGLKPLGENGSSPRDSAYVAAWGLLGVKMLGEPLDDVFNMSPETEEQLVNGIVVFKGLSIPYSLMKTFRGVLNLLGLNKFVNINVYRDPLILDLNGNGKIDVSAEGSGVYFDFNKDGIASSTGWLTGGDNGDGLLVFDKNFDGIINDGTELFGDDFVKDNGKKAKNGFDALASLDSDNDGIISALDPMYHFLKVWKDTNGDGISQADELFSLSQLGIAGLVTGYQDKNESLEGGNLLSQEGVYIKADGTFGVMGDVNFVQDFTQIRSSISA